MRTDLRQHYYMMIMMYTVSGHSGTVYNSEYIVHIDSNNNNKMLWQPRCSIKINVMCTKLQKKSLIFNPTMHVPRR